MVRQVLRDRVLQPHLATRHHVREDCRRERHREGADLEHRTGTRGPGLRTRAPVPDGPGSAIGLQNPEHDAGRLAILDQVPEHERQILVGREVLRAGRGGE